MQVNRISAVTSYSANGLNRNQNNAVKKNDVQFGALIIQTATDSYAPQMQKGVKDFMGFMQQLVDKAIKKDSKAANYLEQLIGKTAAQGLIADKVAYTEKTDKMVTKLLPMSGLGTRGAELRDKVTNAIGLPRAPKPNLPLPAKIGEDIHVTTANNVLLDMMRGGVLSPFEKLGIINTKQSEGDATVIIKAIDQGLISGKQNIPVRFLYTDGLYEKGYQDCTNLLDIYNKLGPDSGVKLISSAALTSKQDAAGKLGVFVKQPDGSWKVFEKPSMEELNKLVPDSDVVAINTGSTLITPEGLFDIERRIPAYGLAKPSSLTKIDNSARDPITGEKISAPRWHVTEGMLKPASEEGALRVVVRDGKYIDTGSGAEIVDTIAEVGSGKLQDVFPAPITEQFADNVKVAPDGLSATFNYDGIKVVLPTVKGEAAAKLNTTQG